MEIQLVPTGGHWTPREAFLHINILEKAVALLALYTYCKDITGVSVHSIFKMNENGL